ncbi:MAG TPA: 2-oxo acid dehydrogenase subunit E2 [Candidatus Onthovicinus excrementipullorum]|nr:2-oxo acid dehydrogenase subunit E2 [Candidatus Onthovicinus excrementipullorum]
MKYSSCTGEPRERQVFDIQRKIVAHMTSESWQKIPHVAYVYEPDVSKFFQEFRSMNSDGSRTQKITFNTLMLRTIVEGLKAAPSMNSHLEFNPFFVTGEFDIYDNIDITMPYMLPSGEMMTINLRNCENRSLDNLTDYIAQIGRKVEKTNMSEAMYSVSLEKSLLELKDLKIPSLLGRLFGAKVGRNRIRLLKGQEKKDYYKIPESERITKEDLRPGTITVSNIGSLDKNQTGLVSLLEIIPPQCVAIGIGAVMDAPGVVTDEDSTKRVDVVKKLPITIAFDHRALDFDAIIPFMRRLDEIFADPSVIRSW